MSVENLPGGQTTSYSIQVAHSHSEGIVASPVAGKPPQNASLVRLHAPIEFFSVYWSVVSTGKAPTLPSFKSFGINPNRVFLGGERVGVITPDLVGHIWCAAGRYDYVGCAPEGLDSNFGLACCPWELTSDPNVPNDFYIPQENFIDTLFAQGLPEDTGTTPPLKSSALNLQMMISP